jgi:F-box domain
MSDESSSSEGDQSSLQARTEILDLLMPMFSGTKDDYGNEAVPPLPLTYDRVNEGRPPSSDTPLFRLPVELLNAILLHISHDSLASLAQVNRDCRQLARSRQFASVCLNYSDNSLQLVLHLIKESTERLTNRGLTNLPSLGACIRRLTVATSSGWVGFRHNLQLEELQTLTPEVKRSKMDKASAMFFDNYIPAIQYILPLLPHLELLDWEDRIDLSRDFFQTILLSHFQHLKLFRVAVADEFQVSIPKTLTSRGWPLRSLYLELNASFRHHDKHRSVLPLSISLLRACAPTLESLTWIGPVIGEAPLSRASWDLSLPPFENLRELVIKFWRTTIPDLSILHALIPLAEQCRLRSLSIAPDGRLISEFVNQCGKIQSLERLLWSDYSGEKPVDFVLANDQLLKLSIPYPTLPELLQSRLLPAMSRSFVNLTSLRLTWKGISIPEEALRLISTLKWLEQICLSAGEQAGWRHDWLIDHQSMREAFSKLPNLRKFAFPRDSYDNEEGPVERYYSNEFTREAVIAARHIRLDADDQEDMNEDYTENFSRQLRKAWERLHRGKMLSEADQYLQVLPDSPLEWMYFGQIPMGVMFVEGKKKAYPLFHERDDCYTLLNKMFSWDTYDE